MKDSQYEEIKLARCKKHGEYFTQDCSRCFQEVNPSDTALHTANERLTREKQAAEAARLEAVAALEADASDLWDVTNAIKKEIDARRWITEGRGSYAYDDDRYRQETKAVFDAITRLIDTVQEPAQLRFHAALGKGETIASQLREAKARLAQVEGALKQARDLAFSILEFAEHGNYDNGNTANEGTADEGRYMAYRAFAGYREKVAALQPVQEKDAAEMPTS